MAMRKRLAPAITVIAGRQHSFVASEATLDIILQSKPWPSWLRQEWKSIWEMRSNWAGETGAVAIYRGCQSALPSVACRAKRHELQKFVEEHVASEEAHLRAMEFLHLQPVLTITVMAYHHLFCLLMATRLRVLPEGERSWMPATAFGWALGYLSTKARGEHGMYVTTRAVESFVEEHYGDQIARLEAELRAGLAQPTEAYTALLEVLRGACADEVAHKEDAAKRIDGGSSTSVLMDSLHFSAVYWASRVGAAIAKRPLISPNAATCKKLCFEEAEPKEATAMALAESVPEKPLVEKAEGPLMETHMEAVDQDFKPPPLPEKPACLRKLRPDPISPARQLQSVRKCEEQPEEEQDDDEGKSKKKKGQAKPKAKAKCKGRAKGKAKAKGRPKAKGQPKAKAGSRRKIAKKEDDSASEDREDKEEEEEEEDSSVEAVEDKCEDKRGSRQKKKEEATSSSMVETGKGKDKHGNVERASSSNKSAKSAEKPSSSNKRKPKKNEEEEGVEPEAKTTKAKRVGKEPEGSKKSKRKAVPGGEEHGDVKEDSREDKKKKYSRKSAAYHRAVKMAREEGFTRAPDLACLEGAGTPASPASSSYHTSQLGASIAEPQPLADQHELQIHWTMCSDNEPIEFVKSQEAPLQSLLQPKLRLDAQPRLKPSQLQANYGRGYSMLVNMGYTGGGPTPLCGVLRVARAGLQEDEAMVVDASAKRGLKRRMLGNRSVFSVLERLLKAEEDLEDEEIEEENDEEGLDNLCALGQAVVRELFACRDRKLSVPALAKKPKVPRLTSYVITRGEMRRSSPEEDQQQDCALCPCMRRGMDGAFERAKGQKCRQLHHGFPGVSQR
eukprot:g1317.t1